MCHRIASAAADQYETVFSADASIMIDKLQSELSALKQELATERERFADAEKVIDGIDESTCTSWVLRNFAKAYRVKYPKGGGK